MLCKLAATHAPPRVKVRHDRLQPKKPPRFNKTSVVSVPDGIRDFKFGAKSTHRAGWARDSLPCVANWNESLMRPCRSTEELCSPLLYHNYTYLANVGRTSSSSLLYVGAVKHVTYVCVGPRPGFCSSQLVYGLCDVPSMEVLTRDVTNEQKRQGQ